jgi:hypothetical protein
MEGFRIEHRESVIKAVRECDRLGCDSFLQKYGFREATHYFLLLNGRKYASKAIYGVAYGFEHPDKGPLASDEFNGGAQTVQRWLEQLGFTVLYV